MAGTPKRLFGPLALTNTLTTNVYVPASALIYDLVKQLHIVNKTGGAVTFSLWLGGTGGNVAGTELYTAVSVPANTAVDYFFTPGMKMASTDFLVGGASALTSLTITGFGESVVV